MKKQFKDTAVGKILGKVAPTLLKSIGTICPPVAMLSKLISVDPEITPEDKKTLQLMMNDYEIEAFRLEVEDRKRASNMFEDDSIVQKIFALAFLVAYFGLIAFILNVLFNSNSFHPSELAKTMVTMVFTGTSMKLNTIIDFLFGGSVGSKKEK